MPFEKGHKLAKGRPKGRKNNRTIEFDALMARLDCRPEERLAKIVAGDLPCGVCFGAGKTKYPRRTEAGAQVRDKKGHLILEIRTCESCYGTLREHIAPDLIFRAAAELLQYSRPKRKAIEHSGPEGGPIPLGIRVISVKADK